MIKLRGYDADGDELTATIAPGDIKAGKLYQLSQVYSDYGYEPKLGDEMSSSSVVTGSNNRIVFTPNRDSPQPRNAPWRQFTYTVNDGTTTSNVEIVKIVGSDKILVGSSFFDGAEGWTISQNGAGGVGIYHDGSSRVS